MVRKHELNDFILLNLPLCFMSCLRPVLLKVPFMVEKNLYTAVIDAMIYIFYS